MCLKIQSALSMPAERERIGRTWLKGHDVYRLMGERLFAQGHEEEYADLYSAAGKPAISPILLALMSVFQFMEKLADRQAVFTGCAATLKRASAWLAGQRPQIRPTKSCALIPS